MPNAKVVEGKKRVQFDFTQSEMKRIARCKKALEAASAAEVVRRSVKLMDRALRGEIYVKGNDGELKELVIF